MINASLVKELRDKTGAGMMDCKKALVESNGDIEKAVIWLRENGILKAQKKAVRIAAEGLCSFVIKDNKAVLFEVNSETDFVAKTKEFQALVNTVGQALIDNNVKDTDSALNIQVEGETINDLLINATATIGEKIALRRVNVLNKNDNEIFGFYNHMSGKIVVVNVIKGEDNDVAKDVCMHIAAMNPLFLNREAVDPNVLAVEKDLYVKETIKEGKPEKIIDKIVEGKISKYFKSVCLVEQQFVKDDSMSVGEYLKSKNCEIKEYLRLEVGEGIEKRKDDFVAEVMEATKV